MLNKYLEDAFNLCRTHKATFENIKQYGRDCCKMARVDFHGGELNFPLNIEIYRLEEESFKRDETVSFKLALFYKKDGKVFKDEAEYKSENETHFAAEAVIPCGTFDPRNRENFKEKPTAIFHGKIISVGHIVLDDVKSLHIVFTCLGEEYDLFIDEGIMPFAEGGNIISGVFYAVGLV